MNFDIVAKFISAGIISVTLFCAYVLVTADYEPFHNTFLEGWKPPAPNNHRYC